MDSTTAGASAEKRRELLGLMVSKVCYSPTSGAAGFLIPTNVCSTQDTKHSYFKP